MNMKLFVILFFCAATAFAYPEFQKFSQSHSKRTVNCGMCHVSPEGPDGLSFGQIGSLDSAQMEFLKDARRAMLPGVDVQNPILNLFGNKLVRTMGVRLLIEARKDPATIYFYMKDAGDLDGDGVSDAEEFLDGTNPVNPHHGDPVKLFLHNVRLYAFEIAMIFLATILGIFGLTNTLLGFASQPKKV